MRRRFAFLLLLLTFVTSGCIAVAREGYSSPRAPGAERILPSHRVLLEEGYPRGWTLWRSASALRLPVEGDGAIELLVCNARETLGFFAIPPLPPLVSQDLAAYAAPPLVVRLAMQGSGEWTLDLRGIEIVTKWGERFGAGLKMPPLPGGDAASLCSCFDTEFEVGTDEPIRGVGDVGAWLAFPISSSPDQELRLELGGVSRDGLPVRLPPVELRSGARWCWFLWVP